MTPFKGQAENAGHFLQPTTKAIGHKVIALFLRSWRLDQAEREDTHQRHHEWVGADLQTNSDHLGTADEASTGMVERASLMGRFSKRKSSP
jgi:hypothetical protein